MGLFNKSSTTFYYFLKVVFVGDKNKKEYYYLSNDKTIGVGDYVAVDSGGEIKICQVLEACVYSEKKAPYPVEQTKYIVSKFDKESIKDYLVDNEEHEIINISKNKDCGNYEAKTFLSNGYTNELNKSLVIENNVIKEMSGSKILFESGDMTLVLPDNLVSANLSTYVDTDVGDEGIICIARFKETYHLQKLVIPAGYNEVDLSGIVYLKELYISNGVQSIIINDFLHVTLKTLFIPKDLKEIKVLDDKDNEILFNALNFDAIYVDRDNQNYVLENGILFSVKGGKKTVVWASKNQTSLCVDHSIEDIAFSGGGLTLEIENTEIFENIKKRFLIKIKYSNLQPKLGGKNYVLFLNSFKKIIVPKGINDPYLKQLDNLEIKGETKIVRGINAKTSFFDEHKWFTNGCKTKEELLELSKCYKWSANRNNYRWEIKLADCFSCCSDFIAFYQKKDGFEINSLVDLIGVDFHEKAGDSYKYTPVYYVNEILELENGVIDTNLFDEDYLESKTKEWSDEEKHSVCSFVNSLADGLAHILAFRSFKLSFKTKRSKMLFLRLIGSHYSLTKEQGEEHYHFYTGFYESECENTEGKFRVSRYILTSYNHERREESYVRIVYGKDDNEVLICT